MRTLAELLARLLIVMVTLHEHIPEKRACCDCLVVIGSYSKWGSGGVEERISLRAKIY